MSQILSNALEELLHPRQVPALALVHMHGGHLRLPHLADLHEGVRPLAHDQVQHLRLVGLQAVS
ncbi:MAG: hypothetical protein ACE5LU_13720 [Anaerolineae bacterium]